MICFKNERNSLKFCCSCGDCELLMRILQGLSSEVEVRRNVRRLIVSGLFSKVRTLETRFQAQGGSSECPDSGIVKRDAPLDVFLSVISNAWRNLSPARLCLLNGINPNRRAPN
ncbi:uncharacterized protein LOC119738215 [Patiria miniata]|uniref:Uncharacterized protein n=1 Tax=Patiria miniata TaxID=46514 RepID=A0A914AZ30_PATMI|nr:uncharacterized protein LOC119738215 [Patiria miniata]